jgi:hypothetical protein
MSIRVVVAEDHILVLSIRVVVAEDHILVLVRAGFRRLVDSVPSLPRITGHHRPNEPGGAGGRTSVDGVGVTSGVQGVVAWGWMWRLLGGDGVRL